MVDRMTEKQAADLLEHIDELGAKLTLADDQAAKNRNLTRWLLGATGLLVIVCVVLIGVVVQNKQNAIASCESGNNLRKGQRAWFTEYFTVATASATAQHQPQAVLDYYDDMLTWTLEDTLPLRDCDHLDQALPEPGPAPSFEDALKAALADEAND